MLFCLVCSPIVLFVHKNQATHMRSHTVKMVIRAKWAYNQPASQQMDVSTIHTKNTRTNSNSSETINMHTIQRRFEISIYTLSLRNNNHCLLSSGVKILPKRKSPNCTHILRRRRYFPSHTVLLNDAGKMAKMTWKQKTAATAVNYNAFMEKCIK